MLRTSGRVAVHVGRLAVAPASLRPVPSMSYAGLRWMSHDQNEMAAAEPKKKTPFYKRFWRGSSKEEDEEVQHETEEKVLLVQAEEEERGFLEEERLQELRRRRNKSGLRYSDRLRLHGLPPLEGLQLESEDYHCRQEYKAAMFGLYGRSSGASPSACWPTKTSMDEQREWESVFYDGVTDFNHRLMAEKADKEEKERQLREREERFAANLLKMKVELKQWETRKEMRESVAQKDRQRREKVLAELREEYGYDLDPLNPHYAEKIAEKEKEFLKREKEEKKKRRAEEAKAKALEEAAAKEAEAGAGSANAS